jgi:single-strand DNA-binding protein
MAAKSKTTKAPAQEAPAAEQPQSFRSYNRVQLAGRLVADPDLKYTPSGKAVCRMRLATNDTKVAQFHDIVAWETVAETAAESLRKGAKVTVEGRLQTRTWETADGASRRATEIVASGVAAA